MFISKPRFTFIHYCPYLLWFSIFSFVHQNFITGSTNIFLVLKATMVKFNWVTLRNGIQIKENAMGRQVAGIGLMGTGGQKKSASNSERKRLLWRQGRRWAHMLNGP
jgi:hypothetical protein